MSPKKRTIKKAKRQKAAPRITLVHGDGFSTLSPKRGEARRQPYFINPESGEEREKRLAARKALTLKAFQIAYENNHRRQKP